MRNLLVLSVFLFASCTPVATYPPIETDAALSFADSSNEPVPTILAEVITYAHEHCGGMEVIVFNLPEGINATTYDIVSEKLGGALPMKTLNQIAYHIIELRVRGFDADADILFPTTSGGYGLATIHLDSSLFNAWAVTRDRVWLIPTNSPPPPHYEVIELFESE